MPSAPACRRRPLRAIPSPSASEPHASKRSIGPLPWAAAANSCGNTPSAGYKPRHQAFQPHEIHQPREMAIDDLPAPGSPTRRRRLPPGLLRLRLLAQARPKAAIAGLLVAVATMLYLVISSGVPEPSARHAAEAPVRFDREREGGEVEFPALDELVERDRLWPPDLSPFPTLAPSAH
jgi:hypothetical protein